MMHKIVRQQTHPQFGADPLWSFAAKHVQRNRGLDAAQVEFRLPALTVQIGEVFSRDRRLVAQRGDDQ